MTSHKFSNTHQPMKRKLFTILSLTALLNFGLLSAQNNHNPHLGPDGFLHCGTDENMHNVFNERPDLKADYEARQTALEAQDAEAAQKGYPTQREANQPPVYIVPVVFHIIHDYGAENISDAQVLDQMRILNEDYRMLNSDISLVVPAFQNTTADCEIEFRLANVDPNGNCTNGIDRIASPETYIGDDGSKLNYWTRTKYLNVWVVKTISSGAAGYAYLPGTAPSASADGIIILSTYIGSIGTGNPSTSRALTHEVGHFLNLLHVWGSTNQPGVSCGNDQVSDTPVTKGWTTCNLNANDICTNNVEENVQNFLEYSYCSRMFTPGQKTRMRNALNSTPGQRDQLLANASSVINDPMNLCAPIADFGPFAPVFVCEGGSVNFSDLSSNGASSAWSWSFPGGTPNNSNVATPSIQYNTAGTYNVTLTASNASGSDNISRTNHVIVSPTTAQYQNTTFADSYESLATFNSDWFVYNPSGNAFTRVTNVAYTGSASVKMTNTSAMAGQKDELISPTINMSQISSPTFTFRVAFAQRTGTTDKLRVLASTDCGQTWTQRYIKSGAPLSTTSAQNGSFTPTQAQWRLETVSLNSTITSASNVRFKFEFTSDGGNNLYIDDINIAGPSGIDAPEMNIANFDVFPNPAQDNTLVAFNLTEKENVTVEVLDMTGRRVSLIQQGELQAGNYNFPLMSEGTLSSGIYIVRLMTADGRAVSRKLVVQ